MQKFSKIIHNGKKQWIEFCGDSIFFMLGEPQDDNFTRGELADLKHNELKYLPPSVPSKVIGVGWNYKDLVGEQDTYLEPIVFLKSPTSICAHGTKIKFPDIIKKLWVEVELVIVIGKKCSNITVADASKYILGYTVGSDLTALNIHDRDWHLARSKAFDDFAPLGRFLVTGIDTESLSLKSTINGIEAQSGKTKNRVLNDNALVSLISSMMTLMPGDVIFTGTPARATEALVCSGDHIWHEIEGVGDLSFEIV